MDIMKVLCVVSVVFSSMNASNKKNDITTCTPFFLPIDETEFPLLNKSISPKHKHRLHLKIKPLNNPSQPISPQAAQHDELASQMRYSALATKLKQQKDAEELAEKEAAAQKAYAKEHPSLAAQAHALFKTYHALPRKDKKIFMATHLDFVAKACAFAHAQEQETEQSKPTLKASVSSPVLSKKCHDQPASPTNSESSSTSHDGFELVGNDKQASADDFVDVSFDPNNKKNLVLTYQS